MAQKFQDSTPQRKIWTVGKATVPFYWTGWGYDTAIITLKPDPDMTGSVVFDGFLGFQQEGEDHEWGDWWTLKAFPIGYMAASPRKQTEYFFYDLALGPIALKVHIIGFSRIRVREQEKLRGSGDLEIVLACHAGI